jgi:prevent-host-death family protein
MTTLTVGELEANLREVLERVRAGESVVVESDGAPAVQISPCDPLAALEAAFPGIRRATKPALDLLTIRPLRFNGPVDAVELIRYERGDR